MNDLLDFFDTYERGTSSALVYDDGFRRWSCTYDELRAAAEAFARQLTLAGLRLGDRLLIWGESRPEWVVAFWGAILCGVTIVPVDRAASPVLVSRIVKASEPRAVLAGDGLPLERIPSTTVTWRLRDVQWSGLRATGRDRTDQTSPVPRANVSPETIAEIVFTSGTTGDPKGVLITHRNIVANITPIEREAIAYRHYLWPFRPIRFLSLLPLSHMFGQALSMFFPPLVDAATVFTNALNPDDIIEQTRRHHITLIVTVPRVLQLLRARVSGVLPRSSGGAANDWLAIRLWRHRDVHRLLGWRFCGFVLGGAPLDPDLERFWGRLGHAVIQGYGLTETAPIVAWNHPFKTKHGTVGRPLDGVNVRLGSDGEILVKGPIVTQGYLNAPEETRAAFEGGWFHTGDVGVLDDSGHLVIRGRKKDLIATPEGLKVFPEDVERVLDAVPGVRESAVVGRHTDRGESVHAVLVIDSGADPEAVVRSANESLEAHERIKGWSLWTAGALPRTEPLRKLKRSEIRAWLQTGDVMARTPPAPPADVVEEVLSGYAKGQAVTPETTLDQLGISSLDRVELSMSIEERTGVRLNETGVSEARTVDDLRRLAREETAPGPAPFSFPSWNRWRIVQAVRNVSQRTWILPMAHVFFRLHVEGRDRLPVSGPVIFAGNHQSHFDTPVILSALPRPWRRSIAVAMWKEYFDPYFLRTGYPFTTRLVSGFLYYLLAGFFNAFPLPQTEPGARHTLRYMGDLVSDGWSILIFPEGTRTERGEISAFQPGVGLLGAKLRVPIVPVRLEGVDRVLHHTWRWPRRDDVRVTFGSPLTLEGADYPALARQVRDAVLTLQPRDMPLPHRSGEAAREATAGMLVSATNVPGRWLQTSGGVRRLVSFKDVRIRFSNRRRCAHCRG